VSNLITILMGGGRRFLLLSRLGSKLGTQLLTCGTLSSVGCGLFGHFLFPGTKRAKNTPAWYALRWPLKGQAMSSEGQAPRSSSKGGKIAVTGCSEDARGRSAQCGMLAAGRGKTQASSTIPTNWEGDSINDRVRGHRGLPFHSSNSQRIYFPEYRPRGGCYTGYPGGLASLLA